jgi:hypothetical protein
MVALVTIGTCRLKYIARDMVHMCISGANLLGSNPFHHCTVGQTTLIPGQKYNTNHVFAYNAVFRLHTIAHWYELNNPPN